MENIKNTGAQRYRRVDPSSHKPRAPPRARPLDCGPLRNPLDVRPTPKIPINTKTPRNKPRSEVPPPQVSVAMKDQSWPSPAPCQRGSPSPETMEEEDGGAIITMEAKDQRENLSPPRGRPWRRKHKGETLSPSLSVVPECHRGNHRRGDRLHQHHPLHHHPHLLLAVHSPAPRCNPLLEHGALCHIL